MLFLGQTKKSKSVQEKVNELKPDRYEDLLRVEFLDSLEYFLNAQGKVHIYRVGRLANLAILIGFSYRYGITNTTVDEGSKPYPTLTIDLGSHGSLTFKIDYTSDYAEITTPCDEDIIISILNSLPTVIKVNGDYSKEQVLTTRGICNDKCQPRGTPNSNW